MIPTTRAKLNIYPWQIVRSMPNLQHTVVAQFHRRQDADEYLRLLKRLLPAVAHEIVFQPIEVGKGGDQGVA